MQERSVSISADTQVNIRTLTERTDTSIRPSIPQCISLASPLQAEWGPSVPEGLEANSYRKFRFDSSRFQFVHYEVSKAHSEPGWDGRKGDEC